MEIINAPRVDQVIRIVNHVLIQAGDGKFMWHGFHPFWIDGTITTVLVYGLPLPGKIGYHQEQPDIRAPELGAGHLGAGHAVKAAVAAYKEILYPQLRDVTFYFRRQHGADTLRRIPVPYKAAYIYGPLPIFSDLSL